MGQKFSGQADMEGLTWQRDCADSITAFCAEELASSVALVRLPVEWVAPLRDRQPDDFDAARIVGTDAALLRHVEVVVAGERPGRARRLRVVAHADGGDRVGADRIAPGGQQVRPLSLERQPRPLSARDRLNAACVCPVIVTRDSVIFSIDPSIL
jgi:hypothetical protein